MLELEWKIAENPSNDNLDTGGKLSIYMVLYDKFSKIYLDEVKSSLKSTYKEYEKTSKTNVNHMNLDNSKIVVLLK